MSIVAIVGVGAAAAAAVGGIYYSTIAQYAKPHLPERNSLLGKTMVVTGGTTGLGLESAKRLAAGGANVIITARTAEKGQTAIDDIKKYLSETVKMEYTAEQQSLSYKILDFSDLTAVKANIQNEWNDVTTIDVLLNNAGIFPEERVLTMDGYESTIQTNHLGYFVLSALLFPKLDKENGRIVNVSSVAHSKFTSKNGLNFDNLWKADQIDEKDFAPLHRYGESKLANVMFTQELQRRINSSTFSKSVSTMSLHPGVIQTGLGQSALDIFLGRFTIQLSKILTWIGSIITVESGTATQVWLCSTPTITDEMKSQYFVDCRITKVDSKKTSEADCTRLWEESEQMTSIQFTIP